MYDRHWRKLVGSVRDDSQEVDDHNVCDYGLSRKRRLTIYLYSIDLLPSIIDVDLRWIIDCHRQRVATEVAHLAKRPQE